MTGSEHGAQRDGRRETHPDAEPTARLVRDWPVQPAARSCRASGLADSADSWPGFGTPKYPLHLKLSQKVHADAPLLPSLASLQPDPASLAALRVSLMARTKERRNLSSQEQAASSERAARRCAGILKAARMLPSQEVAHWAHMHVENCTPEPAQVVKLSAVTTGGGGRVEWRGRLRTGGSDVILEGTWVRQNFKAYVKLHVRLLTPECLPPCCFSRYYLASVQAASGRFLYVPTGNARPEAAPAGTGDLRDGPEALFAMGAPWAIPTVECPEVAYRQGAADVCAAHGLASAVHEYGDTLAAASIAACARAALASGDAFGYVCDHVNDSAIRLGCGASFRSPHQLAACRLGRCWHARGGNTRLSVRTPCASVLAVSVHRALPACGARRRLFGVRVAHRHNSHDATPIIYHVFHTYHAYDFMFWHV